MIFRIPQEPHPIIVCNIIHDFSQLVFFIGLFLSFGDTISNEHYSLNLNVEIRVKSICLSVCLYKLCIKLVLHASKI